MGFRRMRIERGPSLTMSHSSMPLLLHRFMNRSGEKPQTRTRRYPFIYFRNLIMACSFPIPICMGAIKVTLTGNREAWIENYRGLLEYTESHILLQGRTCQVCFESPTFLHSTSPTDRSISLSLVSRPPPNIREQIPTSSQTIRDRYPSCWT